MLDGEKKEKSQQEEQRPEAKADRFAIKGKRLKHDVVDHLRPLQKDATSLQTLLDQRQKGKRGSLFQRAFTSLCLAFPTSLRDPNWKTNYN